MANETVEVELSFDRSDYIRASVRLLLTKPTFVILLLVTAGAVIYALYFAVANAAEMGFGAALAAQLPFLLFILIPFILWFSLWRQASRILSRREKTGEKIAYVFSDDGFVQRVRSNEGADEHQGGWDTFARVVETGQEFLMLLPRQGGVFLPKKCFASEMEIHRFREMVRHHLGDKAKLQA